jgi:hypothetical protein
MVSDPTVTCKDYMSTYFWTTIPSVDSQENPRARVSESPAKNCIAVMAYGDMIIFVSRLILMVKIPAAFIVLRI